MAITANDIHNQSFSIDRKGYDVDEVDVFLEHVAEEIDEMNALIAQLEQQLEDASFSGFDAPVAYEPVIEQAPIVEPVVAAIDVDYEGMLAEKDDIIAEKDEIIADKDALIARLERQLEEKRADGNAIAQALIVAQRSADDIIARANAQATETVQEAREEAQRVVSRANQDRQDVIDSIRKLQDDREEAREEYADLLNDIIEDASRKLSSIMGTAHVSYAAQPRVEVITNDVDDYAYQRAYATPAEYATPQTGATVAVPTPTASAYEKDLSGFGDVDEFEFEEID